jgi:hypothetical protein
LPITSSGAFCSRLVSSKFCRPRSIAGRSAPSAEQRISRNCASARPKGDAKLKRLYDAIENGIADVSDPMLRAARSLDLAEARAVRALDVLQVPDGCSRAGRACAACWDQGPAVAMAAQTAYEDRGY